MLSAYTFGCHSWRHLIGGGIDCYSCSAMTKTRYGLWQKVSFLNEKHAAFAWASMISVGLTDLYVDLVGRGASRLSRTSRIHLSLWNHIRHFEHDVLVIGAGGAGLRAAISCRRRA